MRRQRNRLLHAARLEVGGRDEVQFVVAGSRDQQIVGEDVLLAEQSLVGHVAAEYAHVWIAFYGLAAVDRVAIYDNQFLMLV